MANELQEKKIIVMGTGGSGKTHYATNKLWNQFKNPMAYDVNGDYEKAKGGLTYYPHDIDGEIWKFLELYNKVTRKKKVDALFFDDAESYINYQTVSNPYFKDLVVRHRNKGISLVFICKRPQNIPTLIIENAHILKIFLMEGKNALDRLKDIDERIINLLPKLKDYEHIHKTEGKEPKIIKAVTYETYKN